MALRTCMICPAGHGAQRRERNQQHVAPVAHAAHMQRGSCTTVEHRAHVWHAAARALVAHHAVCRAAPHQHARGDHRARHARAARQLAAHPHPACARRVHQLPARARTERQRAARARVRHPADAAGAAAAAAACPGARSTAHPARAPRQVRAMDAPHAWYACPARALAQTGRFGALPVGLGSSRRPLAGQQQQAPEQHSTRHSTRARRPTRSCRVPRPGRR